MGKRINIDLFSVSSIRNAQKQLELYSAELESKCQLMVSRLAEIGIEVAENNKGNFGRYITFTMKLEPKKSGAKALVIATANSSIKSSWKTADGIKTVEVDPLLMAEFGSGFRAKNPKGIKGVGQGTFPNQTHAFDEDGWYWYDLDGELHHSYGISPTQPMYKASVEMMLNIRKVANEVFGSG